MTKERIELKNVTLVNRYEFGSYFNHVYVTRYLYKFVTEDGKIYVWKTTTYAGFDTTIMVDGIERNAFDGIHKGDIVDIKGTIKGESDYNGERQTELERVKILGRSFRAETPEEKKARIEAEKKAKEEAQRASLKDGDTIMRMTYKNYKEHYSDCETVENSFEERNGRPSTIEVIVRSGRLVPSGVRGKHYAGYQFVNEEGKKITYCAVSAENAEKRVNKEYPNNKWELDEIFNYTYHRIW